MEQPPAATDFGELLRSYRKDARLTQEALAERAALSRQGIADLERGARRAPHRHTIRQLADALRLSDAEHTVLMSAARRAPRSVPVLRGAVLPLQVTSFVGREQEVTQVRRLLATARLVTLTGPGGVGKTRLALEVARETADAFRGGAILVELASVADPALVQGTVAAALEVEEQAERALQQTLLDALRPRQLLVVLDNCEHLVQASAELAEAVLRICPEVRILSTSREPLGLAGEITWRVPTLAPPEAVRLFVQRACRASPGFELTPRNAPMTTRVCEQLDCIPLAIELAAARVSAMSIEQIAARLDGSLGLLTGGNRTAPPRQRTLRGTFDWSYGLLNDPEQQLLKRLAVFAGGWTLEAAEAICAGWSIALSDVLDLLVSLVDKSLVVAQLRGSGLERYRLLEALRTYASEKLHADSALEVQLKDRHRDWCIQLAERFEADWRSPRQKSWFEELEREEPNLRTALRWSADRREPDVGLRLAAALCRFWDVRGKLGEGRAWLAELLALADESVPRPVLAKALSAAGYLAVWQIDIAAETLLGKALELWRKLGDGPGIASTLVALGMSAHRHDDLATAKVVFEEGLALARSIDDWAVTYWALTALPQVLASQGDYLRAQDLAEEGLALNMEHGDSWAVGSSLRVLAHLAELRGDHARATALLRQGLVLWHDLDFQRGVLECLELLADVSIAEGGAQRAARLFGAGESLRAAHGGRSMVGTFAASPVRRAERVAAVRATLTAAAFEDAWAEGQSLSLEDAVAHALATTQD